MVKDREVGSFKLLQKRELLNQTVDRTARTFDNFRLLCCIHFVELVECLHRLTFHSRRHDCIEFRLWQS